MRAKKINKRFLVITLLLALSVTYWSRLFINAKHRRLVQMHGEQTHVGLKAFEATIDINFAQMSIKRGFDLSQPLKCRSVAAG